MAIVPAMHKQAPYNTVNDFSPIGLVVDQPIVLITRKDLPVSTIQDFVAYTKTNQNSMQFGIALCLRASQCRRGYRAGACPIQGLGRGHARFAGGRLDYFCTLGAAAIGR